MHYLLFADAHTLLPQVLEEEQFLALLPRGEISPDARLFVSDTDSYLPALEVAVLLANARGLTVPPLPPFPADRFATVVARMKNDRTDEDDSGDSDTDTEYPEPQAGKNEAWDAETDDLSRLPLIGAPIRLPNDPPRPAAAAEAAAKPRLVPLTPPVGMKDSSPEDLHDPRKMLYDHVRDLATVSLNSFFGDIEEEIAECLRRYRKNVRLQIWGWVLFPVPFVGLYLLWKAWRERQKIEERLAFVGVADYNWKETLRSNRETFRLSRTVAPLAASMVALTVVGLLFVYFRTDFVDRALYFFATDSLGKSRGGATGGGASRPQWLGAPDR